MRYKTLIFDLDGTLVDTAADIAAAVDQVLAELGRAPAGESKIRTWIGKGAPQLLESALQHSGRASPVELESAALRFAECYSRDFRSRSRLYPGVADTLPRLAARGLQLAVCTNKPGRFVKPLLDHLGIGDFFTVMLGGDALPEKKPHPAPLLHIARQLSTDIGDCLLVGDSSTDIEAARHAGMAVVAVSYGYNHGIDIRDCDPDTVIDSIAELVGLLDADRSAA